MKFYINQILVYVSHMAYLLIFWLRSKSLILSTSSILVAVLEVSYLLIGVTLFQ